MREGRTRSLLDFAITASAAATSAPVVGSCGSALRGTTAGSKVFSAATWRTLA